MSTVGARQMSLFDSHGAPAAIAVAKDSADAITSAQPKVATRRKTPRPSAATQASLPALQAAPFPTSLAGALQHARSLGALGRPALAEAESAVRLLARATGRSAEDLPAAPAELRPLLGPASQHALGKRWSNALSALRRLLRAVGLHAPGERTGLPAGSTWAILVAALPLKQQRAALTPFARYCIKIGVEPHGVTEVTLRAYGQWRETYTLGTSLTEAARSIRQAWHRAQRDGVPDWPGHRLVADRPQHVEALPIGCFPDSFLADLETYLAARGPSSVAFIKTSARPLREASVKELRRFLVRAASLIAAEIGGPDQVRMLADLVHTNRVEGVLTHMHKRSGATWRGHALNMANVLLVLAEAYVRPGENIVAEIRKLRDEITSRIKHAGKHGLSPENCERLRSFDDAATLRRFLRLPEEAYKQADELLAQKPVRAAQLHERALALQLLQRDPMRRYNLTRINVVSHLKRSGKRFTGYAVPGKGTKNGIPIEVDMAPDLADRLARHLEVFRPHLRGAEGPWLFPAPDGGCRTADNLSKMISKLVTDRLAVPFSPQLMRHLAATLLFEDSPENGPLVQRTLRHTTQKTSQQTYGVQRNRGANAVWQEHIRERGKGKPGPGLRRQMPARHKQ